ncbi:PglZ domain protein [Desulfonatronospira thiodismutans ASO3-1]|uniref:PglZ domain protein n=1 Tax=Desulfonatronospira thiodismutans ASO3-1 TaxID=555779 RepID=D6SJQ3_9BACT|nr:MULTISPECIES: BREX-1 system phosphatase PglZ type B [Desulfonatronospira]EFI36106.1 PglZ domain protein [Desulfonatronospira thiodismutans ASO3-1]RQD74034.1 MAG: BREX-1 system phosphatase PglZ type B [Desulfonatronospira sp. MSAO_Bac3]
MRVIDHILRSIRDAALYNPEVQAAPSCILWPDWDRQWEPAVNRLLQEMPELFVLGKYSPEQRTGPAIWLRCVILFSSANVEQVCDAPVSESLNSQFPVVHSGATPVIYLPGVSRQDLRAVESCPDSLKPLAELQYRGVIWSQVNAKDWTILAFLKSDQGGLGLDVARDSETKRAIRTALMPLLDEDVDLLECKRLDKDYFHNLLSGGDPVRDLLQWISAPDDFRNRLDKNHWEAFVQVCKSQFGFDPQKQGVLTAAHNLAQQKNQWRSVWSRYREAPHRYPGIPGQIRKCRPPAGSLMWYVGGEFPGWPQWNEQQEKNLRENLSGLKELPAHNARQEIIELEKIHASRRNYVWAELGLSPLAMSLKHLAVMAEVTRNTLAAGTLSDLAAGYSDWGWEADDALLRALACVHRQEDFEALSSALRTVYLPWSQESSRHLQRLWLKEHSVSHVQEEQEVYFECCLFVDGLRFDCARRLQTLLEEKGISVSRQLGWAALPSVTATGKPAASPVAGHISAAQASQENFEPCTAHHFKKLLQENQWTVCRQNDPLPRISELEVKKLWVEFGDIDHEGHEWGWKLSAHVDRLLREVRDRIEDLIQAGWTAIRVVTDHGWLLLPGGLPKIELPRALTQTKWSRCAVIKSGADTDENLYPWYWNPDRHFALADGISCFRRNDEYSHGGLSLQECLLLKLTVFAGPAARAEESLQLMDVVWKGLRCTVVVEGWTQDLWLDVRTSPGEASSSLVLKLKLLKKDGSASVVVEDEQFEGQEAHIVLINAEGQLISQTSTIIGG